MFISKLLNFKGERYPWKSFFVGRFFRIIPLYVLSFISVVLIVGILSKWTLEVSSFDFFRDLFRWSGIGILGQPDLNGVENTAIINSFVNWSLLYEWLLYFSLPLISILIIKTKPNIFYLLISIVFIGFAWRYRNLELTHLFSLFGGGVAAIIRKYVPKKLNFNHYGFTILTIGSLLMVVQFRAPGDLISKLFLILAFCLIAMGNDLFGLLKNTALKLMGEISYSTYLLHGILLFVVFRFGYGLEATKILSPLNYCLMIFGITPALIGLSFMTYFFIEKPFIKRSKDIRKNLIET